MRSMPAGRCDAVVVYRIGVNASVGCENVYVRVCVYSGGVKGWSVDVAV